MTNACTLPSLSLVFQFQPCFVSTKLSFLSANVCFSRLSSEKKKSLKLSYYNSSSFFKSWFLSLTIVYSSETVSDIYCVPLAFRSSTIPWTEVLSGVCLWLVGTSSLSLCTCHEGWWQRCWTASATTNRIL